MLLLTTAYSAALLAIIILPTASYVVVLVAVPLAFASMPTVDGVAKPVIMLMHTANDAGWHPTAVLTTVKYATQFSAKQINTATCARISITPLRIIVNFVESLAIPKTITASSVNNLVINLPSVSNQIQCLSNYAGLVGALDIPGVDVAIGIKMSFD